MSVNRHEVVQWFTTPKELRKIADDMQRRWETISLGDDTTIFLSWGNNTELVILIDQDRPAEFVGEIASKG